MFVKSIFCTLGFVLSHLFIQSIWAIDPSSFLARQITVVQDGQKAKPFPGGTDEKYYGVDSHGNQYKIRIKNLSPLYAELGANFLIQSIGLPSLPVYPLLLTRGENGLPTQAEARQLSPQWEHAGKAGKDGFVFQTTLQPLSSSTLDSFDVSKLNSGQLAELVMQMAIHYVVGNNDFQLTNRGDGNIGFTDGHFVTLDITQAFRFSEKSDTNLQKFKTFFDSVGFENHKLDERSYKFFLEEVNVYLSRLEALTPKQIGQLFGPYQKAMNSFQEFKGWKKVDYISLVQSAISNLRSHFNQVLPEFSNISRADHGRPHIYVGQINLSSNIPSVSEALPLELLWSFYFEDNPKVRGQALTKWAEELDISPKDVIRTLREKSSQRTPPNYFIGIDKKAEFGALTYNSGSRLPMLPPRFNRSFFKKESFWDIRRRPSLQKGEEELLRLRQLHLNTKNSDTLVVVPPNDLEAEAIAFISKEAGASVLKIHEPHGVKLTQKHLSEISKWKRQNPNLETIIIVEMPGETPLDNGDTEEEKALRNMFAEVVIVDHHDYIKQDIIRYQVRSSLEQVAFALGYDLGYSEFGIAVQDRSFIPGLVKAEVPLESLKKHYFRERNVQRLYEAFKDLEPVETKLGPLYIIDGVRFSGRIGDVAGALSFITYPEIPSLLTLKGKSLGFSGNKAILAALKEVGSSVESKVEAHFSGGDPDLSTFWGLKGIPESMQDEILKSIEDKLELKISLSEVSSKKVDIVEQVNLVPKIKLNYKVFGEKNSKPIVLVHGLNSAWQTFIPIIEDLSKENKVIVLDLPGHGGSEELKGVPYSNFNMSVAVARLLDQLGVRSATVLGHSLGGRVAVKLYEHRPDLVERLIIEDMELTQRAGKMEEAESTEFKKYISELSRIPRVFESKSELIKAFSVFKSEREIESLIGRRIMEENGTYRVLYRPHVSPQFAYVSNYEDLSKIPLNIPTVVIMPEDLRRAAISKKGLKDLESRENVQIVKLPNAVHNVHGSQTEAFLKALKSFLTESSAPTSSCSSSLE